MDGLTSFQKFLLDWLSKADAPYGECRGKDLDILVSRGLVAVGPVPSGCSRDYARVDLTDAGRDALASMSAIQ